jgi:acylphosphatase
MAEPTLHAIVRGHVQGVFFRHSARERARDLALGGWVRNLPDGAVEAFAQGPSQALEEFLRWLRAGPPSARVEGVEATWGNTEDRRPPGFRITH